MTAPEPARGRFPSTHWSLIVSGDDPADRQQAAAMLAERYWQPICRYVQRRWARDVDEANDLTQAFFCWMLEGDFLARADPSRGRLRAFVKVALDRFLAGQLRASKRLKRGGAATTISTTTPDGEQLELPDESESPATALDREWRAQLLAEANQALEARCREQGRQRDWEIFFAQIHGDAPGYLALAERLGLSRAAVSNSLQKTKREFRDLLRELIAETVRDPRALAEEYRELFGREGER